MGPDQLKGEIGPDFIEKKIITIHRKQSRVRVKGKASFSLWGRTRGEVTMVDDCGRLGYS